MTPITLNRNNILNWMLFGLIEMWRVIRAILTRDGGRVASVTRYVEKNATSGNPSSVLEAIDTFSYKRRFLMNVGDEKGAILVNALKDAEATRVLELGAYCGYSAVLMAREISAKGGKLISLEASAKNAEMAGRVVAHAGLSSNVEFRVGKASEQIEKLTGTFDLVFIDHWKDDYLSDLKRLEDRGLLSPGARIVADNVGIFSNAVQPYLEYVRESDHMESTHYVTKMEYNETIADGVEVSIWQPRTK